MKIRRVFFGGGIVLLTLSIVGASIIVLSRSSVIDRRFDEDSFENPSRVTLCFDLRDEDRPLSGLVFNLQPDTPKGIHIVLVPFASIDAQNNSRLLTTWSTYGKFTLLTYFVSD